MLKLAICCFFFFELDAAIYPCGSLNNFLKSFFGSSSNELKTSLFLLEIFCKKLQNEHFLVASEN